jgi:hypothetical protein
MKSILIGKKAKPTYLVEIDPKKKQLTIYKPDRYSAREEFYEKYVLGETILTTKYDKLFFKEHPIEYRHITGAPEMLYATEMAVVIKKKQIRISTRIQVAEL